MHHAMSLSQWRGRRDAISVCQKHEGECVMCETYEVCFYFLKDIEKKIKRIMNKCNKAGVPFTYEISEPYTKTIERHYFDYDLGIPLGVDSIELKLVKVTIDCKFRRNGWTVLGSVSRKTGILQCHFHDTELLKQYHDTDFHCDHCKTNRYRHSVILLENEQGDRKLVGSTCVKEFTCGLDGELVVEYAAMLTEIEQREVEELRNGGDEHAFRDGGGWFKCKYAVERVVACAASLIRRFGFVSVKKASESIDDTTATKHLIPDTLDHYKLDVTEEDEAVAKKAIEWCRWLSKDEIFKSEYLFNVHEIVKNESCESDHFGMLAALIPAYHNATSEAMSTPHKRSEYVGEVSDKLKFTAMLSNRQSFDSQFGVLHIYVFEDDDSNVYCWKTSKWYKFEIGDALSIEGTVKEHSEYHGIKQTVLTRCKLSAA